MVELHKLTKADLGYAEREWMVSETELLKMPLFCLIYKFQFWAVLRAVISVLKEVNPRAWGVTNTITLLLYCLLLFLISKRNSLPKSLIYLQPLLLIVKEYFHLENYLDNFHNLPEIFLSYLLFFLLLIFFSVLHFTEGYPKTREVVMILPLLLQ